MFQTRKNKVSVLLGVLLLLGCTASQNVLVRAQPVLVDETGDNGTDPLGDLSLDFGAIFDVVGNATQGLGGLLDGLLGNATNFLDGLFGGSTGTGGTGDNETLDISVLLDFIDDTFGVDVGNLTVVLDDLLGNLDGMSNETVNLDINQIVNSAIGCDNLISLAGTGITCLTNLNLTDMTDAPQCDTNNCTPECKIAYEEASKGCPDLVSAIFGGIGVAEVCGQPVVAPSTTPSVPVTPSPTPASPVTPSTTSTPAPVATPDGSGVVQGAEAGTIPAVSSGVTRGLLATSMVLAVVFM